MLKDVRAYRDGLGLILPLFVVFFVSMVRWGDNGSLPEVLSKLVQYRKRQDDIPRISWAFVYPSIVGVVGFSACCT
jgi:type II secretory pathway component PulF